MSDPPGPRTRIKVSRPGPVGPAQYGVWALVHEENSLEELYRWVEGTFADVSWVGSDQGFVGFPFEFLPGSHARRAGRPGPPF